MSFNFSEFLRSGAILSNYHQKIIVGWGYSKRKKICEIDPSQPAFYHNDFFLNESSPWLQFQHSSEFTLDEFYSFLNKIGEQDKIEWDKPEKQFQHSFLHLKSLIETSKIKKAVPYLFSFTHQTMTHNRLALCLKKAIDEIKKNKKYIYGFWNETKGILGLTPEVLFATNKKNHLITMALAGTTNSNCSTNSFKNNKKELKEHAYVVNGIKQSLKVLGKTKIGKLKVMQFPPLCHLYTPLQVTTAKKFDFEKCVKLLHPTFAIGAFPKKEGEKWLKQFDLHTPREMYGAPIGILHSFQQHAMCLVGIRNVQWDEKGMKVGAGCGVIRESLYENELKEVKLKTQAIREQFGL